MRHNPTSKAPPNSVFRCDITRINRSKLYKNKVLYTTLPPPPPNFSHSASQSAKPDALVFPVVSFLIDKPFFHFQRWLLIIAALLVCVGHAIAGPNAGATLSLDLIPNGGPGNRIDDGVTSGMVSGQGTTIAIEVFATGVATPLRAVAAQFDYDVLRFVKIENAPAFIGLTPTDLVALSPVTLSQEFSIGIRRVELAESATSRDVLTTDGVISFTQASLCPGDFDADGMVNLSDFLAFAEVYGTSSSDANYNARMDMDGSGRIDLSDFLAFAPLFGTTCPTPAPLPVSIPDDNLRAAIESALGKDSGAPITDAEMLTLNELSVQGADITDLTGLEFAANLRNLDLGYNFGITDVSPLSGLSNLETFVLGCNRFTDLSWLSGLIKLKDLNIGGNDFTDISWLSGLTNLTRLHLGNNEITDISHLSGLTNLTELGLGGNDLTDISPLSGLTELTILVLLTNKLTDVSPLSGLTKLFYLDLRHNDIRDISSLSGLTKLNALWLRNNDIRNIPSLSGLTNLDYLGLADNDIRDIPPLSGLTSLTSLDLGGNNITDKPFLTGLTRLRYLRLGFNKITGISLSGLTNLRYLDLKFNDFKDISSLSGLTSLTSLDLRGNPLSASYINDQIPVLEGGGVRVLFDAFRKGDFDIELVFLDDVTQFQKSVIQHAARRWMSVIVEDLPDHAFAQGFSNRCGGQSYEIPSGERIDDLRIYVSTSVSSTFAVGHGSPQILRETTHLPVVGCIGIDVDLNSSLYSIPLHEIGHVLGFGTLWEKFGFLQDQSWSDPSADTHFNGPRAIAAFDAAGGWDYGGKKVPVGQHDSGSHWRTSVLWGEIMLPSRWGEEALSAITVQSLTDLGYGVDVTQADAFVLRTDLGYGVDVTQADAFVLRGATAIGKIAVSTPATPGFGVNVYPVDASTLHGTHPYGQGRIEGVLRSIIGDDARTGRLEDAERIWGRGMTFDLADNRQMWGAGSPAHAEPELRCGADLRRGPIYVVDQQGRIIRTIGD